MSVRICAEIEELAGVEIYSPPLPRPLKARSTPLASPEAEAEIGACWANAGEAVATVAATAARRMILRMILVPHIFNRGDAYEGRLLNRR